MDVILRVGEIGGRERPPVTLVNRRSVLTSKSKPGKHCRVCRGRWTASSRYRRICCVTDNFEDGLKSMTGLLSDCRITFLGAVCMTAIFTGCADELAQDPPPDPRTRPVYDAATGVIPLPNSAALDDDGTLPRRDGAGRDSAQGEFYRWFSELPGWPTSTPITIPFDGLLDPDTVQTDNIRLGAVSDGQWIELSATLDYAEDACGPNCAATVTVTPSEPLEDGRQYAVAITRGVTNPAGVPIGEPTAFFYAMSPEPLVDEDGDPTLALFEDDPDTAVALEGLRRQTAPFLDAATTVVERDDLALVFGWQTRVSPGVSFDPEIGRLPIPNDLALDPDGTFPRGALTFCGNDAPDSCAQGDFDTYLDGLHGWPESTPISVPWAPIEGAEFDDTTITDDSVQLWRLDAEEPGPIARTVEVGDDTMTIVPEAPIEAGGQYAVVVTRDVAFARGEATFPFLPDPVTALAVQDNPVADFAPQTAACGESCGAGLVCADGACRAPTSDCDSACGSTEACVEGACVAQICATSLVVELTDCEAEGIEEARLTLAPTVELIDDVGDIEYDELAALSVWTAVTDTFIDFDTAAGRIPFPSTFLTAGCPPERPICALYDPDATDATGLLLNALSERSGFSTFATNFVPTSGLPIDASTLEATTSVRFAQVPGVIPELLSAEQFSVDFDAGHILVSFDQPLAPETLSVGVVTTDALGSNGFPVQPAPTFALIRNPHPLVDENGASTVDVLDDATAQQLEPARQGLEQLFDNAFVLGLSRQQIASAWPFTTGTTTLSTRQLRARTNAQIGATVPAATAPNPDVIANPSTLEDPAFPGVQVSFDAVAEIHRAVEFETVNWVGQSGIVAPEATTNERVGVTLYVPEDPVPAAGQGCEPPYDVAIVQHGLGSWRDQPAFAMANDFAEACIAVIAMDLPVHGGRTPGSSTLHPATRPSGSGDSFLTADLLLSLAHFQQSVIDLSILTRLIREGGFDSVTGTTFSNEQSQIGYLGVSLGGQIGTAYLAVEPDPVAGVINVAGAKLSLYLTDGEAFSGLVDQLGVSPGTLEFIQTIHFLQWATDWIDPFVFASSVTGEPLPVLAYDEQADEFTESPGTSKSVLVQMVDGDAVAPNSSTELLAATFGVDLMNSTYFGTVHGFLAITDPAATDLAQAQCGRDQAVAYLASAFDGTATVPPALDAQTCVANF
jgi:pimeloyl-ACP methyl ester carboxylesterase